MPKCVTSTSPESSGITRYLPRRSTFVILRPSSRDVKSLRFGWRRMTRIAFLDGLTSASLIRRPTTSFSRSRRITSTSGSSTSSPLTIPLRRIRSEMRAYASRAACCSASFLERPVPVPSASPPTRTVAVNSFAWSGPRSSQPVLRHRAAAPATRAPAGSSCSRGRPRRGRTPPSAGGRAVRSARATTSSPRSR